MFKTIKIRSYDIGLHFRDGEFKGLLGAGQHWFFDPLDKVKVEVVSQRPPWLAHEKLDVIVKAGALKDRATISALQRLFYTKITPRPATAQQRPPAS